ncbi:hypothetical protein AAC387_Pa05g3702 [Persea americana]
MAVKNEDLQSGIGEKGVFGFHKRRDSEGDEVFEEAVAGDEEGKQRAEKKKAKRETRRQTRKKKLGFNVEHPNKIKYIDDTTQLSGLVT